MDTTEDLITLARLFIIGLSIFAVILWIVYYLKYKKPAAIAAITWLMNLVAFNIYRFLTIMTIEHARIVDTWSIALHVHAIVLLIAAYFILKGHK